MKLSNPYRCADHRLRVTRPVSPASFKVLYHKPWNPCYLVSIHAVEVGCRDPQRLEDVTIDFRLVGNIPSVTIEAVKPLVPYLTKRRSLLPLPSRLHVTISVGNVLPSGLGFRSNTLTFLLADTS